MVGTNAERNLGRGSPPPGFSEPDEVDAAGERGYRTDLPMRMRYTGTERYPLVLSDQSIAPRRGRRPD
jgi:hypothetical protein